MGGEHKCPLCNATFTRPQHVGRHLRAHTGDRPYECKECPLRFARSDLLSRHVNKAHKTEDGQPKKDGKKTRRKSSASANQAQAQAEAGPGPSSHRNSVDVQQQAAKESENVARLRRASDAQITGTFNVSRQTATSNQETPLQAQKMYPHHPLLNGTANYPGTSNTNWQNTTSPTFTNPFTSHPMPNPLYVSGLPPGYGSPFTATPMLASASDQGLSNSGVVTTSPAARAPTLTGWTGGGYEFGFKKKACDQCNHSKVRCDFNDPCARCTNKNLACSYNKPSKSRSIATSMPMVNRLPAQTTQVYDTSPYLNNNRAISSSGSPQSYLTTSSTSPPVKIDTTLGDPTYAAANAAAAAAQRRLSMSAMSAYPAPQDLQTTLPWQTGIYPSASQQQGLPLSNSIYGQPMWTQSMSDLNALIDPAVANPALGSKPTVNNNIAPMMKYPSPSSTAEISSQGSRQTGSVGSASMLPMGTSSTSPGNLNVMAPTPTPALTNVTTSPSGSEQSLEKRNRRATTTGNTRESSFSAQGVPGTATIAMPDTNYTLPPNYQLPLSFSPARGNISIDPTTINPSTKNTVPQGHPTTFVWPTHQTTMDPRLQLRTGSISSNTDWDNDSAPVSAGPDSSNGSIFLDNTLVDDTALQAIAANQSRRRSSAGTWASAFNQMTLQDANGMTTTIPAEALTDPYTASQVAQTLQARRPTFPLTFQNEMGSAKVPSMTDVKELWKLFMSEPMSGVTPSAEKSNPTNSPNSSITQANTLLNAGHTIPGSSTITGNVHTGGDQQDVITPRPGMGYRTLSKSNSMPDLTSPLNTAAIFNFLNGLTPKPSDNQSSGYIQSQSQVIQDIDPLVKLENTGSGVRPSNSSVDPSGGKPTENNTQVPTQAPSQLPHGDNTISMKQWKNEIKQRQAGFIMQPNGKMGKANSLSPPVISPDIPITSTSTPAPGGVMAPPQVHNQSIRPMASVLQMNPALQQTLAPERLPSFGTSSTSVPTQASFRSNSGSVRGGINPSPNNSSRPSTGTLLRNISTPLLPDQISSTAGYSTPTVSIPNTNIVATESAMPSLVARPGNKRLPSQTLVPSEEGKRSGGFSLFDDQGSIVEDDYLDSVGVGGGDYAGGMPGLQVQGVPVALN